MADAPRRDGSFWTTLPGLLTGIAAVITAAGALLGALVAAGVCRPPGSDRARIEADASIQSFGTVQVGQGSPASVVTISNRGKAATTVDARLGGSNPDDFKIRVDTCRAASLSGNTSCQVHVSFSPRSQGDKVATLALRADNADVPPALAFTGVAAGMGVLSFDPTSVSLSLTALPPKTPPTSRTTPLTITNTGTGDLRITNVRTDDLGAHFSVTAECDNRVLGPGQPCRLTVQLRATTNGTFSAHALVFVSPGPSPQSVPLGGFRGSPIIVLPTFKTQL